MPDFPDPASLADCQRIYELWHNYAVGRQTDALCDLYAEDALLETPLGFVVLPNHPTGLLQGKAEIRRFFEEGAKRRPNELVRWYRTGTVFANGQQVLWEYPRVAPDGDQVDLVEAIDVKDRLITHHRIYWGWFGVRMLIGSAVAKALEQRS